MTNSCQCLEKSCCAAQIEIFQQLDEESLWKISSLAIHKKFSKGENLFVPGRNEGLFLIAEGKVKIYELSPTGKEQLLRVLSKGDFCGETSLFSEEESYCFGQAISEVRACYIRKQDFVDLLMSYPSISLKLLEQFSKRMSLADHHVLSNSSESVEDRLLHYFYQLAAQQDSKEIVLPLPFKELAAFLSTTPETLSRRLKILVDKKMIEKMGKRIKLL